MVAVNYSTVRSNLKSYCDKAYDDDEVVVVTRKEEKNVVIMGIDQYNDLLREANNAKYLAKLDRSFAQIEEGRVITKTLEELEAYE